MRILLWIFSCHAVWAATPNMEAFVDQCPGNDPVWARAAQDLRILRNGVAVTPVACTEPVTSMAASPDLDVTRIQQTLRLIYEMDIDAPVRLPWTPLRMYDWVKLKIGGINIDTASGVSYCCTQFNGRPYFSYGVSTYTDFSRIFGMKFEGLIGLLALVGHEVRHVDGYSHVSCCGIPGGCDLAQTSPAVMALATEDQASDMETLLKITRKTILSGVSNCAASVRRHLFASEPAPERSSDNSFELFAAAAESLECAEIARRV